jgi:hypothetical protein
VPRRVAFGVEFAVLEFSLSARRRGLFGEPRRGRVRDNVERWPFGGDFDCGYVLLSALTVRLRPDGDRGAGTGCVERDNAPG